MAEHRKFTTSPAFDDAAMFRSWADAAAALVSLTDAPNNTGALLGVVSNVELRPVPSMGGCAIVLHFPNSRSLYISRRH